MVDDVSWILVLLMQRTPALAWLLSESESVETAAVERRFNNVRRTPTSLFCACKTIVRLLEMNI